MMNKQKIAAFSVSAILAAVSGIVLFRYFFGYLHMRELYQMFLFTPEYFLETVSVPGGFADYIGRFITQFSYWPAAGAAIDALMLFTLMLLSCSMTGQWSIKSIAASSLPLAAGLWFFCIESSIDGAMVALLACVTTALLTYKKNTLQVPLSIILYFLCGPVAIVYPVLCWIRNGKHVSGIMAVAAIPLCAFVSQFIYILDWKILFGGFHYNLYNENFPYGIWITAAAVIAAVATSKIKLSSIAAEYGLALLCLVLDFCVIIPIKKENVRIRLEIFEYEYLEEREDWNAILEKGRKNEAASAFGTQAINLALAVSGELPEKMFNYRQAGPSCLVIKEIDHHYFPLLTAEVLYYSSLTNLAQEFWFDMMKATPDHQQSSRAYMRIAQTNACNGDVAAAKKYAEVLKHTLFYREWAENFDAESVEYRKLSRKREAQDDFFYSLPNIDRVFMTIYKIDHLERMAAEYAMAYALLEKNIDKFLAYINEVSFNGAVPDYYQQAYLLLWDKYNQDFNNPPEAISRNNLELYMKFMKARNERTSPERMYKKYGKTYLFYYFYAQKIED